MIVSKLELRGFRGIRTGEISLQKFTALIGANNCGKTTITEALALVLGRDRLVRPLTEHDFHGSTPGPTDRISIVATLTGFEPNDPQNHTDWFRWGRSTIKWQDADTGIVKSASDKQTDKLACQIAFAARFDHDSLETVTARYFYDADIDPFQEDAVIATVPTELIRQVGFFLVPANRTWDRTISFGSELFRRVVAYVGGRPAAAVLAERERLRAPNTPLEADENLSELVRDINKDIKALFGRTTELKLRVTSTDSDGILEAIVPHFTESGAVPLPSRRHGSGLISLQTLILLMRFGHLRVARGEGFMMVIEEPELHVPPPLQRKLLRMMQSMATQTIVTTHSPTVAAVPDPHQILLVVNTDGHASVRPLIAAPLAFDAVSPIRGLLLSDRDATVLALMHPSLLIPEGKTDANWLRLLVKTLELNPSDVDEDALSFAHEVGIIPTKDARVTEVFEHLRQIHPAPFCLFDGDATGNDYEASCCRLAQPPRIIVRWPMDWAVEHVIGWIVEADPTVLGDAELLAAGVPQAQPEFVAALSGPIKTNEIIHARIADALTANDRCRGRTAHILRLLADLAAGRTPVPGAATSRADANGITTVWTFNHALRGI
jgi:energy-coupling factor transporter ATP-binding protein EcfA2